MSRHGYRISICFSDKAVTTPVSHWNSINLVCQGPMRKSKLHLTLYQLTITYKWTLPVSIQQVMILLSIRLLANKKKENQVKNGVPGSAVLFCLSCFGVRDFIWGFCCVLSFFQFLYGVWTCKPMHHSPSLWFNCCRQSSQSITEVCLNFIRWYNLCYFPTVPNKP